MPGAILFVTLFLCAGAGPAQELKLPSEIRAAPGELTEIRADTDCPTVEWLGLDGFKVFPQYKPMSAKAESVLFATQKKGVYYVVACVNKGDVKKIAYSRVVIGDAPPGPDPPGPKPPPEPPPPPAPIPVDGFRVLVVYESSETMTPGQHSAVYGKTIRDYLDSRCAAGPGGRREWRVWDPDIDTRGEAKHWQDAMRRKRDRLPWIVVSTGKTGYEGPLPDTLEKTMDLIRKYAEGK